MTATLADGNFSANAGTLLSNYILPTTAAGLGQIDRKSLSATIVGTPAKTYDGTLTATLASNHFALVGFIDGEGGSVSETTGLYDVAGAGGRTVSAVLDGTDFSAALGTNLGNYIMPTTASGAGQIDRKQLIVGIVGLPTKIYDGNSDAGLNVAVSGFITGEGGTVTRTAGSYDSANAGTRTVTAVLGASDFALTGTTDLANYTVPTSVTGAGQIDRRALAAAITGTPAKTYDGTTSANLVAADFALTGFITGEGATVTQTGGTYAGADAGTHAVSTTLATGDFAANVGTLLSNYVLPINATGTGTINRRALAASIVGTPTRTYDGTLAATLGSNNFALAGFIDGEGASVSETTGLYDVAGAGGRTVSAVLDGTDFLAALGTNLGNYIMPTTASGAGQIDRKQLIVGIVGLPTKTYDRNSDAGLNVAVSGFVPGEGGTVTRTAGSYDSANAGTRTVTAVLGASDFALTGTTDLANYTVPTSVTGAGQIDRRALAAAITGTPAKTYDGTTSANLVAADFALTGFITGEGVTVTQTGGTYAGADAGSHAVSTTLATGDFAANVGTLLSNYVLPPNATGTGTINRRGLAVSITGTPTEVADGSDSALLSADNFAITGFVGTDGATATGTDGRYDSANPGSRTVMAALLSADLSAAAGTNLANYAVPATASGAGTILPAIVTDAASLDGAMTVNLAIAGFTPVAAAQIAHGITFALTMPRAYIPYPAPSALSTWQNNEFALLPSVIDDSSAGLNVEGEELTITSGPGVINTTSQILLQGDKQKNWRIQLPPLPAASPLAAAGN